MEASVGVIVFTNAGVAPEAGCWLMYFNRSRVDGLGGWLGRWKRSLVEKGARKGMAKNLLRIKGRLEANYRTSQGRAGSRSGVAHSTTPNR
jgi:hypothetical protein